MALKANVFTNDFDEFREAMADLTHYQFITDWGLKLANTSTRKSLAVMKKRGLEDKYGGGNAITITNVFYDGTYPLRAPGGVRTTQGRTILQMTKEMEGRFHSYLLVGAFERFEKLLKIFYSNLLFQLRGHITLPSRAKFHKFKPEKVKIKGTPPYYLSYSTFACSRNCDEAVAAFGKKLPMHEMTYQWRQGMTFLEFLAVLAFSRNMVVHSEGRWPDDSNFSPNANQKAFIESLMHKSVLTGDETLLPTDKRLDLIMDMLASYAYGIYVLLSEKCGMTISNRYFER